MIEEFRTNMLSVLQLKSTIYRYLEFHDVIGTFGLGRIDSDPNFLPSVFEELRYKYKITDPFMEIYFNKFQGYLLFGRESEEKVGEYVEFPMVDNFGYTVEFDAFEYEVLSPGTGEKKELKLETSLMRNFFSFNANTE